MSSTALTIPRQQTRAIQHPHPLLSVMAWELRRFRASRLFGLQALGFFCFLLLVTWFGRTPSQFSIRIGGPRGNPGVTFNGFVAGTSAWGLAMTLPTTLLLLSVLLPFVNADGVTRDLSRRTHELLMTTRLPNWAYVWGRYLMGLLVSLGLAVLMLAAILGMGLLLHLTLTDYPAPEIDNLMTLWVGMVVPATVLVSSVSFALGTMLPRQATLVKIVILMGWFVGTVILPSGFRDTSPPAWYINWDPTSAATGLGMAQHYQTIYSSLPNATSKVQLLHYLLGIENMAPNISAWLAPHLLLAGVSLLLVVLAAVGFQRFRNTFGA